MMQQHAKGLRGVIHCFSYSKEMAQEYVKMGFHIGVGGVVTFKNSKKLKEVVADIPMEKILLENGFAVSCTGSESRKTQFFSEYSLYRSGDRAAQRNQLR